MKMIAFKESNLTNSFVSPDLCRELVIAGCYRQTNYWWRIITVGGNMFASLQTELFDPDNYYRDGNRAIGYINPQPVQEFLPAYNMMEIEKLLPGDYTITFSLKSEYILMPSTLYHELEGIVDSRLPDVFARHLIECMKRKVVDINIIQKMQA